MHFFLDDNCEGALSFENNPGGDEFSPENAFTLADELIDNANNFNEVINQNMQKQWHQAEHGALVTDFQCIPTRYVLCGVQIHCDTDAQDIITSFSELNGYTINNTSEINIFVTNITSGSGAGFTWLRADRVAIENFSGQLLNHEIGHCLNLKHPHRTNGDDCSDTWALAWEWDLDGDGATDQAGRTCWNNSPGYEGQDACDTNLFSEEHPCCPWINQNNNVMTYSAWANNSTYAAMTPCQINRTVSHINAAKCDFLAEPIENCPPVKAFVGTVPSISGTEDCPTCFYLSASDNEDEYEIKVFSQNGSVPVSTGTIQGNAGKFCINPVIAVPSKDPVWPNGFTAGETYTIKLTVRNDCGDAHQHQLSFVLPEPCHVESTGGGNNSGGQAIGSINVSPNPSSGMININFDANDTGILKIYGIHNNSNSSYGIVHETSITTIDQQSISLNINNWLIGSNSLIFDFKGEVYVETIIKQ